MFVASMPRSPASPEWFAGVDALLHPGSSEEADGPPPEHVVEPKIVEESPMSFEDEVRAIEKSDDRLKAVSNALASRISEVMNEGTDLEELYGEGRISRRELLAELTRRIPGSDAYPDLLEREAWRSTSMKSDPQVAAMWLEELSKQGSGDDLIPYEVTSSSIYGDPRIPYRLDRYQALAERLPDGQTLSRFRNREAYEWGRWYAVSPALARAWRDALPAGNPLRVELERQSNEEP